MIGTKLSIIVTTLSLLTAHDTSRGPALYNTKKLLSYQSWLVPVKFVNSIATFTHQTNSHYYPTFSIETWCSSCSEQTNLLLKNMFSTVINCHCNINQENMHKNRARTGHSLTTYKVQLVLQYKNTLRSEEWAWAVSNSTLKLTKIMTRCCDFLY